MRIVSFDRIQVYFVSRSLKIFYEVGYFSNVYQDHVFVLPDFVCLLEHVLRLGVTAVRKFLLVYDFQFKLKIVVLVILKHDVGSVWVVVVMDVHFTIHIIRILTLTTYRTIPLVHLF